MFIPCTKIPIFQEDGGSYTIPGVLYLLAVSGALWWIILYVFYPPAVIVIYLAWAVGYGSLALTGALWVVVVKVAPAIRSHWTN